MRLVQVLTDWRARCLVE